MQKSIYTKEARVFQELLRQLRVEQGVTQAELAERLDTLQAFVSNYERGERRLDFIELTHVLTALGIPLRTFVERYEHASQTQIP